MTKDNSFQLKRGKGRDDQSYLSSLSSILCWLAFGVPFFVSLEEAFFCGREDVLSPGAVVSPCRRNFERPFVSQPVATTNIPPLLASGG